jgi:hypothetical protein
MNFLHDIFLQRMNEARKEIEIAEEKFHSASRALSDIIAVRSGLGYLEWDKNSHKYKVVYYKERKNEY